MTTKLQQLPEEAMEWFLQLNEEEKMEMKEKHFPTIPIQHSSQWGFHFTIGQIMEMYESESSL